MAKASMLSDQFNCPICLDQLKDPVTTACGHSFCMVCINSCWDEATPSGLYRCPQCRHSFTRRPVLKRNVMFAEMAEKLRNAAAQSDSDAAGEVECDSCTGRKQRAVKSCLVCLASFCRTHLEPHYVSPTFKSHKLVRVSAGLKELVCPSHQKPLDVYCRTDQRCVCVMCTMDEHSGHQTVPAAAERADKQKQLKETQRTSQQMIQQKEKELQELRKAVEAHKRSAQAAVEDSKMVFNELIRLIERKRSEVTAMIRAREKEVVKRTEGVLKRLEMEISELKRRDTKLKELPNLEDHVQFLQTFQSLVIPPTPPPTITITLTPRRTFMDVAKPVMELKKKLEEFCREQMDNVCREVTQIQILEPITRKEFLEYSFQLTLNPNTANSLLSLSEGNRAVLYEDLFRLYPVHPDRFDAWAQVLCREAVCGCGYWEVEWSGSGGVGIAVSYKDISRKTDYDCVFGCNDKSWSLSCFPHGYSFWHDSQETTIPRLPSCSRIGVYVDHRAGTLSFYSISDSMTLIHRVQTTFTQPLYPGFWLGEESRVVLGALPE
ncbi:tripartite motif-containing protein 16-like [Astyanax mexicanus]|uniref:tripartite motif-containing protein 16-like n=1 Tax=Astyanax mexicanus TaxID=7994 RepID=UPI0020CAFAAA|nr:tripartite motif-containing protein 16-like [Astyanax mexicanus]